MVLAPCHDVQDFARCLEVIPELVLPRPDEVQVECPLVPAAALVAAQGLLLASCPSRSILNIIKQMFGTSFINVCYDIMIC